MSSTIARPMAALAAGLWLSDADRADLAAFLATVAQPLTQAPQLWPVTVEFGALAAGQVPAPQPLRLRNTQASAVTVTRIASTGGATVSHDCPPQLPAAAPAVVAERRLNDLYCLHRSTLPRISMATARKTTNAAGTKAPAKKAAAPAAKSSQAAGAAKKTAAPKKTTKIPAAPRSGESRTDKPRKAKLVRDSFTIPKAEYSVLEDLKVRAGRLGRPTKKSEVLRAGVIALAAMDDAAFLTGIGAVPALKTGRPAKD